MEEKLKLIQLNSNAWHYKLIKFMFGRILPEPKQLKNLCPYFWMLIASLLLCPIVGPIYFVIYLIKQVIGKFSNWMDKRAEKLMNRWIVNLSPIEAWDLFQFRGDILLDRPRFTEKFSDFSMLSKWASAQGIDTRDPKFWDNLKAYFDQFKDERETREKEMRDELRRRYALKTEKKQISRKKEIERREKMNAFFEKIKQPFIKTKDALVIKNYNQVIRVTKRILGLIVSGIVASALFFVVHGLIYVILKIANVWDGKVALDTLMTVGVIVSTILVIWAITWMFIKIGIYLKDQHEKGKLVWWFVPFYYISLTIFYVAKFTVWYPVYFIVISFLWRFVCISILWGILRGLGRGLIKFTGIFGEYFGSSYTDYCPGISWDEEK